MHGSFPLYLMTGPESFTSRGLLGHFLQNTFLLASSHLFISPYLPVSDQIGLGASSLSLLSNWLRLYHLICQFSKRPLSFREIPYTSRDTMVAYMLVPSSQAVVRSVPRPVPAFN